MDPTRSWALWRRYQTNGAQKCSDEFQSALADSPNSLRFSIRLQYVYNFDFKKMLSLFADMDLITG